MKRSMLTAIPTLACLVATAACSGSLGLSYESSRIFEKPFKHLFAGIARGYAPCLGYGAVPHFSLFLRRLWRRKREKKYFGSNSLDRDVIR